MSKKIHLPLALISLTLVTACSTPSPSFVREVSDDGDRTTFLLNYEVNHISDPNWKEECSIALTRLDSNVTEAVPLSRLKKQLQIEVPAGKYKVGVLSCGRSEHWDLENFGAPSITASEGKVNYLGRFVFQLSQIKNVNELKIMRGNRDETRKSVMDIARHMSPHWRKRVVSAYNSGTIPETYLQDEKNYPRGAVSHVIGPKASLSLMKFDECEKVEFKTNPTPLGILTYHVTYENDQFTHMERSTSTNSFSESYIHCVEDMLKNFKPGYSGKVDYQINF